MMELFTQSLSAFSGRVVLDASFFMIPEGWLEEREISGASIRKEFSEAFRGMEIYIPETFFEECKHYDSLMPNGKKREAYQFIWNFFARCEPAPVKRGTDMWDLIRQLYAEEQDFLIATGNRTLMERIALEGVRRNVYDWNRCSLRTWETLSRKTWDFPLAEVSYDGTDGEDLWDKSTVYGRGGELFTLRSQGETEQASTALFSVENQSDKLAKILERGERTASKKRHVLRLIEIARESGARWAAFPVDVLYRDENCRDFVGILEPYQKNADVLGNGRMGFLLSADHFEPKSRMERSIRLSDTLLLCLKIVREVCYLRHYGVLISDYNINNFALRNFRPGMGLGEQTLLFDTDSFSTGDYFSYTYTNICSAEQEESMDQLAREKLGALYVCDRELYRFIFRLLSCGSDAVRADFRFSFADPECAPGEYPRKYFPPRIWNMMQAAFQEDAGQEEGGKRTLFSPEALLRQLWLDYYMCVSNPDQNWTYWGKQSVRKILSRKARDFFESTPPVFWILLLFAVLFLIMAVAASILSSLDVLPLGVAGGTNMPGYSSAS